LLGILDPADELVAGQSRDVVPGHRGRWEFSSAPAILI
jgi:hypothetical protein